VFDAVLVCRPCELVSIAIGTEFDSLASVAGKKSFNHIMQQHASWRILAVAFVISGFKHNHYPSSYNRRAQCHGSDGFAFVIQNTAADALGLAGGGIGFAGIDNSLAVKFDTHANGFEPQAPFVSFQPLGLGSQTASLASSNAIPNIKDALVHQVRIDYAPGKLSLFIDDMSSAVLVRSLDLSTLLSLDAGMAYVDFTAATGGGYENHDILNWDFQSVPEPISATLLLVALAAMVRVTRQEQDIDGKSSGVQLLGKPFST